MKFDLISFFLKRVWKYPPGSKETDRSLWTRKKKRKCEVIINNGSYMQAAKRKITKFQGLFSHRLQDSYRKSVQSWQSCPRAEDLYNKNKINKIKKIDDTRKKESWMHLWFANCEMEMTAPNSCGTAHMFVCYFIPFIPFISHPSLCTAAHL